ncbi:MAG: hypothetical protein M0D57_00740 [Sphingobacteriales bacterium JAD_PAG50586_3]|nr:MAG: hypothetical protein M0D57_00740 [Sphingobacteriales bacterium JAD_PAG50586_3]
MSIIVIASKLAEAVATDITTSWIIKKGRNLLGLNEDQFIITLRGLINDTILEFDKNHKIENEGKNFPFYHSKPIIETLIDIKLIGYDNVDIKELKNKINEYPNIIKPTIYQLEIFIALFEQKCRDNSTLKKHQFNDNYKYAIFSILETLDQLNSTVNSVLKEINTSLKTEYFVQLEEIQENIYSFKPKTALERLNKLEKRVEQNGQLTNIIESKICYLKGVCLQEEKNNLAAEYLIKSYLKYTNNTIKSEAAIAYLNINDLANAQKLSEEILKEEPYNINGWVVKILLDKENFIENLKNVPALVIAKRGFALNMIRHMKRTLNFNDDQITDLGIKIPVLDGENLTYFNRVTFELVIEHQLSNYFGSGVQFKYDELGKVYYTNIEKLKNILKLLDNFFSKIDNTEISDVFIELKFFQIMINHLTGKEKQDAEKFKKIYYAIKGNLPIYDILYSQYLADCGDIENAIDILSKSQHESIIYLQLIYYYRVQKNQGL